jgi:rubredoxin-NAD+ reductase
VVAAVGLAPNVGLARESGIDVGRGIQVDRFLATSAPDVYALGDCAEVQGLVLPFIEPITHCARALGFTLSGRRTAVGYPAMPVRLKTPACPAVIAVPSHSAGAWSSFSCKEGLQSLFRDGNGSLQGYALVGAAVEGSSSLTSQLPGLIS